MRYCLQAFPRASVTGSEDVLRSGSMRGGSNALVGYDGYSAGFCEVEVIQRRSDRIHSIAFSGSSRDGVPGAVGVSTVHITSNSQREIADVLSSTVPEYRRYGEGRCSLLRGRSTIE